MMGIWDRGLRRLLLLRGIRWRIGRLGRRWIGKGRLLLRGRRIGKDLGRRRRDRLLLVGRIGRLREWLLLRGGRIKGLLKRRLLLRRIIRLLKGWGKAAIRYKAFFHFTLGNGILRNNGEDDHEPIEKDPHDDPTGCERPGPTVKLLRDQSSPVVVKVKFLIGLEAKKTTGYKREYQSNYI